MKPKKAHLDGLYYKGKMRKTKGGDEKRHVPHISPEYHLNKGKNPLIFKMNYWEKFGCAF